MVGFIRFLILLPWKTAAAAVDSSDGTLASNRRRHDDYGLSNAYAAVDAAATTQMIFSDILNQQMSAKSSSAFTSTSPECWMNSIYTIHRWEAAAEATRDRDDNDTSEDDSQKNDRQYHHDSSSSSLGSSFFAAMTTEQQEIFALELTHCQLMKANRQLYDSHLVAVASTQQTTTTTTNPMQVQGCAVGMDSPSPYLASSCFPLMSEYAFQLYNTMFLHTREVCATLTEERRMQQKEVITHMLVGASAAVSQQMQTVLGEVMSVSEKLNEQSTMITDMTTQTFNTFDQLHAEAISMAEQHKAHEQAAALKMEQMTNQTTMVLTRVQEEVTSVIAEQQKAHDHATAMVLEKVELETSALIAQQHKSQERASALHIEEITQQTAKILERMQMETATLVAEQADKIKEQDYVIERMNELLVKANEQMKPLSSIEFIVKTAEDGFTTLKVLVNFVVSMFITWIMTSPPVLRSGRRYLYLLFSMSVLVELAFMVRCSGSDSWYSEGSVRTWTRAAAIGVFVFSPMIMCFSPPTTVKDTSASASVTMDDLVKVQMDLLAKLNETIPACGNRSSGEPTSVSSSATKPPTNTAAAGWNEVALSALKIERGSLRSPLNTQLAPVVTPTKRQAESSHESIAFPTRGNQSTPFYPNGFALEYMLEKGSVGDFCSSGDDTSTHIPSSPSKSNNKRTVSDIYSSDSDTSNFFSAKDDEDMSDASDSVKEPPTKMRKEVPSEVDGNEVCVY